MGHTICLGNLRSGSKGERSVGWEAERSGSLTVVGADEDCQVWGAAMRAGGAD